MRKVDHINVMDDLQRVVVRTLGTVMCYEPFDCIPISFRFDFSSFQLHFLCSHNMDQGAMHNVCYLHKRCLYSAGSYFAFSKPIGK